MSVRAVNRARARVVAAAGLRRAAGDGVVLPERLRIWRLAGLGPHSAAPVEEGDDAGEPLAVVLERATPEEQRQANGLHVTPAWLADHLVGRAFDLVDHDIPSVCDPACGGGAFLLAAARAIEAQGVPRSDVVRHRLWGADVDPVGLAAAELALTLWAGEPPPRGRLLVGDPLTGGGLWRSAPADGFGAVVGNPPFLNQLGRATVRTAASTDRLRARFGTAVQPYTDAAWLFLLLACDLVRPGGVVTMVQPLSVMAARDGEAVRRAVDARATLRDLWVDDPTDRAFAASVHVCAPLLHATDPACRDRHPPSPGETAAADVAAGARTGRNGSRGAGPADDHGPATRVGADAADVVHLGRQVSAMGERGRNGADGDGRRLWAERLADAVGVPAVDVAGSAGCLGERADVAAGFRDEYYGLVPLVREAADLPTGAATRLVTAGALDWGRCSWGERPARFAKRTWQAPVVDVAAAAALPPDEPTTRGVQRWLARTGGSKVLVANQTRVVELAVDDDGTWVPSVPVLAVVPHRADDLWRLAAAVGSPTATAWLWRRAPGTALHRDALKVAAGDLAALPLPADETAWAAAAEALRATVAGDAGAFDDFVAAAASAYGAGPELVEWWLERLGRRTDSTRDRPVPLV